MQKLQTAQLAHRIRRAAIPLTGDHGDYDALLDLIGNAHVVLLGEATHGTHEFYRSRAEITRRLILEKGFNAVAVEADWPDAYQVNRYIRNAPGAGESAEESLRGFRRFPTWMWRNADVLNFIGWLREYNDELPGETSKVGFYGLDLYSLFASIEAVIGYLEKTDPKAAEQARYRYACLEQYSEDPQAYGYAAYFGLSPTCETEVISQLVDLQRHAMDYLSRDGHVAREDLFYAEQNARLAKNAEAYYRQMFRGRVVSWNLRDRHMTETLVQLETYLRRELNRPAKLVIWEHNSHIGDARATEVSRHGEVNVGQLVREYFGADNTRLIGYSTYEGTVTAASNWDSPAERKRVRPALFESTEALLHEVGVPRFMLPLNSQPSGELLDNLRESRLTRAIGVIYMPQTERISHYFHARLADQFDAVLHFDDTRAVEPLERTHGWERGEIPETYPSAL